MSRKYIASLALAAIVILTVGILIRGRLLRAELAPPVAPSEAAALQQLSQENQLRRLSSFLAERVAAVAPLVEYVPSVSASGVRWRGRDTVVTTTWAQPVVALSMPADTLRVATLAAPDTGRGVWVMLVGRASDGEVISAAEVLGGRVTSQCDGADVAEYVVGNALHERFAGAGLFDLNGRLLGMAVRCGERVIAISSADVDRLLTAPDSVRDRLVRTYGFEARPIDDRMRAYFETDSGLVIIAVRRGSVADAAGWRVGDVIVAVDSTRLGPGAPTAALSMLREPTSPGTTTVMLRRGRTSRASRIRPPAPSATADSTGAGIELAAPVRQSGVLIGAIRPGSPAAMAGLEPGDRLVRVGSTTVTSPAIARRLLEGDGARGTFVVFQRDSVERGVLLPR